MSEGGVVGIPDLSDGVEEVEDEIPFVLIPVELLAVEEPKLFIRHDVSHGNKECWDLGMDLDVVFGWEDVRVIIYPDKFIDEAKGMR